MARTYTKKIAQPPQRLAEVTETVRSLAAENLPPGVEFNVSHTSFEITLHVSRGGFQMKWLPKSVRGIPVARKLQVPSCTP